MPPLIDDNEWNVILFQHNNARIIKGKDTDADPLFIDPVEAELEK